MVYRASAGPPLRLGSREGDIYLPPNIVLVENNQHNKRLVKVRVHFVAVDMTVQRVPTITYMRLPVEVQAGSKGRKLDMTAVRETIEMTISVRYDEIGSDSFWQKLTAQVSQELTPAALPVIDAIRTMLTRDKPALERGGIGKPVYARFERMEDYLHVLIGLLNAAAQSVGQKFVPGDYLTARLQVLTDIRDSRARASIYAGRLKFKRGVLPDLISALEKLIIEYA